MPEMEQNSTLRSLTEFHRARLIALDNWTLVQQAMASASYPVGALAQALGVTEIGAHSVIAMLRGPIPERAQIEEHLSELEEIRFDVNDPAVRRRMVLARSSARHMLI